VTAAEALTRVRCAGCGATGRLILKHNRQGFLTHARLPGGWRQPRALPFCPDCLEDFDMTVSPASAELELIADQITQTIYAAPFALASRRQQELALTCACKIREALTQSQKATGGEEVPA